jgi:CBS domain-containing protein
MVDDVIDNFMILNPEAMIDFRPYMVTNPVQVVATDPLLKCSDLFRKMHVRHLIVVDLNGAHIGIITRADIFTYLDL